MPIHCEIVSQDRRVFSGSADAVVLPGADGQMGILPHHAPLLSSLKPGLIVVRSEGQEQIFTVTGGVVEVQPDQIIILADAAENVMEIDITRAEQARQRAEELLKQGPPPDTDTYLAIEAALKRSSLRLDAARRYRGQRINIPSRPDSSWEDKTT
jgi:F-type H+-transporting ATPase subunit epsilon